MEWYSFNNGEMNQLRPELLRLSARIAVTRLCAAPIGTDEFQTDPLWRDYVLFYEYFHGDDAAGLGASQQTGWTGAIARLIHLFGHVDANSLLVGGKQTLFQREPAEVPIAAD